MQEYHLQILDGLSGDNVMVVIASQPFMNIAVGDEICIPQCRIELDGGERLIVSKTCHLLNMERAKPDRLSVHTLIVTVDRVPLFPA
ncbi:hypothetical protein WEU41_17335 [Pseudomonas fragi]|uniref:hypothetical protein n=1 Tax=Pseudomonas fragi TaxID=296 RepID=UPI003097DF54